MANGDGPSCSPGVMAWIAGPPAFGKHEVGLLQGGRVADTIIDIVEGNVLFCRRSNLWAELLGTAVIRSGSKYGIH